jgi:hypothetical protein
MRIILCLIPVFISTFLNGQKYIFVPDTSISGIQLHDPPSLKTMIPDIMTFIDYKGPGAQACLLNNDETETAILVFHAGSSANEVAEIHVYSSQNRPTKCSKPIKLQIDRFITESNIQLFMLKKDLVKIKGQPHLIDKINGEEILQYIINDFEKNNFLKRINYPEYHAFYTFKQGKLVKMDYGFTYP